MKPLSFDVRPTVESDLERIIALEKLSYPSDEVASAESLRYRQREAGAYFRTVISEDDEVIGFICGTRCETFDEASMSAHDPNGSVLGIHSVVIDKSFRRQGLASLALKWYIDEILKASDIKEVKLIAKAPLLSLYSKQVGFEVLGLSEITHGQDPWYDCSLPGSVEMVQVDAFSSEIFGGNPAAVVFAQGPEHWMQKVAMENNLAETAFLERVNGRGNTYRIRWFTPTTEVGLCGHATLAAAEALFATGRVYSEDDASTSITFVTTNAGELVVTKKSEDDTWLSMDLPILSLTETAAPPALVEALVGGSESKDRILYCAMGPPTVPDWFVHLDTIDDLKLDDIDKLRGGHDFEVPRGVIVTSQDSTKAFDFVSRFFAPGLGIPEDPVTGSAHALLTTYWENKLDKTPLLAKQASKRGGILKVSTSKDRTIVQGEAVLVFKARLFARPPSSE